MQALSRAARLLQAAERAHARGDLALHEAAAKAAQTQISLVEQAVDQGGLFDAGVPSHVEAVSFVARQQQSSLPDISREEVRALLTWRAELLGPHAGVPTGGNVEIPEDAQPTDAEVVACLGFIARANDTTATRTTRRTAAADDAEEGAYACPLVAVFESLAEERRQEVDGVSQVAEAWYHALAVHFGLRREKTFGWHEKMTGVATGSEEVARIQQLGQDYMVLQYARTLGDDALAALLADEGVHEEQRNLVSALIGQRAKAARAASGVKKAVVFSCAFGDGHRSAAAAIKQYLAPAPDGSDDGLPNYEVEVIDTTKDPRFLVEAWYNQLGIRDEDVFNKVVLRGQWYSLHNTFDKIMDKVFGQLIEPCPSPGCNTPRKQQFRAALLQIQPEVIITVYHMELMPVLELARELGGMPLVHIATDMDIKMHEVFGRPGRGGQAPVYPRFLTSVPFDIDASYPTLAPLGTGRDDGQHFLSGYPVRRPFLLPRRDEAELAALRQSRYPGCKDAPRASAPAQHADGCLLVLIMTGGGGQDVPFPYTLAESGYLEDPEQPVHVMVVAGGNNALYDKMGAKLTGRMDWAEPGNQRTFFQGKNKAVTVEILQDPVNLAKDQDRPEGQKKPYYVLEDELALLMDLSDVIITKPGGGTTAEVAYRRLPALFDATKGLLHWEAFTVDVFEQAGRGVKLDKAPMLHWPSFYTKQLSDALKEAWAMGKTGRAANLAQDPDKPDGEVLQPRPKIRAAVHQTVEQTACHACSVFPAPEQAAGAAELYVDPSDYVHLTSAASLVSLESRLVETDFVGSVRRA